MYIYLVAIYFMVNYIYLYLRKHFLKYLIVILSADYGSSPSGQSPGMSGKRGPGRPRSKTATPISRGTRGAPRARRPMGPLLVPLGRSPDATPPSSSPATSRAPSPSTGSHAGGGQE